MRKTITSLLVLLLLLANGCAEEFAGEEMYVGDGHKTRPFAVVLDSPEVQVAAPRPPR